METRCFLDTTTGKTKSRTFSALANGPPRATGRGFLRYDPPYEAKPHRNSSSYEKGHGSVSVNAYDGPATKEAGAHYEFTGGLMSRSNSRDAVVETVTSKWPLRKLKSDRNIEKDQPRGKLRRPRDPRKRRIMQTRPPIRNPLMMIGRLRGSGANRNLIYEREDETYEEEE